MNLRDYINSRLFADATGIDEAISSGSNSGKTKRISAGRYATYKDIESALSGSTYYSWEDGGEYLKIIDKPKPGGLPKNVNFSGMWMSTDKSNVTGNKRIVMFPDLWHYIVLDFDEDGYLVEVGKYWKDNSKKLKNSNNPGLGRYGRGSSTEEILELIETELDK